MNNNDIKIEAILRQYRPSLPPPQLKQRIFQPKQKHWNRSWLAAAAMIAMAVMLYVVGKQNIERQGVPERLVVVVPAGQGTLGSLNVALYNGGTKAFEEEMDRMTHTMNVQLITPVTPKAKIVAGFSNF